MKLVEIFQGKWLGHPLHSALVHVPMGAWIGACVLDIASALHWIHGVAEQLAICCVAFGVLVALLAIPAGIADWLPIKPGKPARKLGVYHMVMNVVAFILWSTNLVLRLKSGGEVTGVVFASSIVGTILIFVSGYLGSLMVFDRGVAVARFSKKEWREIARRGGARVPEEK